MARKYSPEVEEAIWAQLCEGKGPTEIQRLLGSDRAGVGYPIQIADRTLADYVARLKRSRGHPRAYIKPGEEEEAALAIARRSLEAMSREQLDIEARQKSGETLSADELKRLSIVGQFSASLRSRLASVNGRQKKGGEHSQVGQSELLTRLSSQLKQESVAQHPKEEGSKTDQEGIALTQSEVEEEARPNSIPAMHAASVA